MPHLKNRPQQKYQCDFCPAKNSSVRLIKVRDSKHLMCDKCIAALAKVCRIEKEKMDAATFEKRLQQPNSGAGIDSIRGIGDHPLQTETSENAN